MIIEQLYVNRGHFPWRATPFTDHFPIDGLKIESFDLTGSDYDVGDDQIVCPCGEALHRFPGSGEDYFVQGELGWAIKIAREHLAEAHGVAV